MLMTISMVNTDDVRDVRGILLHRGDIAALATSMQIRIGRVVGFNPQTKATANFRQTGNSAIVLECEGNQARSYVQYPSRMVMHLESVLESMT